jgi:hypothetical protein
MNRFLVLSALAAAALASGCIRPNRLQYDYGRSFSEAYAVQADTTRASVKDNTPALSGAEGLALRQAVVEQTSVAKSGQEEMIEGD